ncbi:MAG: glutamine--tRNA ligase/YqeY domain fusion protein [Gemmatimonadota bacterium]|nr:glutamine--tRNA ligase/YqeY domain fusion protein [Gemmatimonadota bacterium]
MNDRPARFSRPHGGTAPSTGASPRGPAVSAGACEGTPTPRDFIRAIVDRHVAEGRYPSVVTRFPPEPNGFLHIGHVKSLVLNFGIAAEYGGRCHLRFDDTNPETENETFVRAIQEDVRWLGYDWGEHLYFAADYFERMYDIAELLIRKGKAYVDSSPEEEIRESRGTLTEPGRPTKYRARPVGENLDLFRRMRAGEFPDAEHVLRAKINLASPNMVMRDPVIYRIRHAHHYRTGDEWCIYPLYDFAHCLEDAIEGVTHSLCTLEFEINREIYDWILDEADFEEPRTHQYEFARLNLEYTVLSKRKLIRLVEEGHVAGWDDPRLPTVAGLRRRGVPASALRSFCEMIGVTKADTRVDLGKLEYAIREALNVTAPRVMGVLRPLRLVVTNWPEDEVRWLDAPSYPPDVGRAGSRRLPFARELLMEADDFRVDPVKGYQRLAPGRAVRLRHAYVVRYEGHDVDPTTGEVSEVRVTCDAESRGRAGPERDVAGVIHWVSRRHSLGAEVRLYDRLFRVADPDDVPEGKDFTSGLNPDSLTVLEGARIEPSVADATAGTRWQLERTGYFWADPVDSRPERLVLNRIISLRSGWARSGPAGDEATERATTPARFVPSGGSGKAAPAPGRGHSPDRGREARDRARAEDPELAARMAHYRDQLGLSAEEADLLSPARDVADFFDAVVRAHPSPTSVAPWLINEVPGKAGGRALADLPFGPAELAALIALVDNGELSRIAAKDVLGELVEKGGAPEAIVARRGLRLVGERAALVPRVEEVLAKWPAKVEECRSGKRGLIGFFVGEVMKASDKAADPRVVRLLLEERLG